MPKLKPDYLKLQPGEAVAKLGLTVESVFVPFSQSRHKDEKHKTLNWKITLKRNGREVVTTDYGAGRAHCPAYKNRKGPETTIYNDNRITTECEKGFAAQPNSEYTVNPNVPILPDSLSVIHSLLMDSEVINYACFEDWASDFGYDPDSRSAEKTYQGCMAIALKVNRAFNSFELEELRQAFQDY